MNKPRQEKIFKKTFENAICIHAGDGFEENCIYPAFRTDKNGADVMVLRLDDNHGYVYPHYAKTDKYRSNIVGDSEARDELRFMTADESTIAKTEDMEVRREKLRRRSDWIRKHELLIAILICAATTIVVQLLLSLIGLTL